MIRNTSKRSSREYNIHKVIWCPNPENQHLFVTSTTTGNMYLWDSNTDCTKYSKKFDGHINQKCVLSWSPKDPNVFFSGSQDTKIYMWDIRTGIKINEFCMFQKKVKTVACDPFNLNQFAAGYEDGSVHIWDISNNIDSLVSKQCHIMA